ncbi:hypothetical protein ACOJBM_01290 [Rhizobium beringeri]
MRDDLVAELRLYVDDRRKLLLDRAHVDSRGAVRSPQRCGTPYQGGINAIRKLLRRLDIKPAQGVLERDHMSFGMPSLFIDSRLGQTKGRTFTPSSLGFRPISAAERHWHRKYI